MFDEFALLIAIIGYVVYRKLILKETHTKMRDGKIILNINSAEIVGMAIGLGMVFAVLVILGVCLSSQMAGSTITESLPSMSTNGSYEMMDSISPNATIGSQIKGDSIQFSEADTTTGSAESNYSDGFYFGSFSDDISTEESIVESEQLQEQVEKDIKTQENVRNVFLESLAFLPEVVVVSMPPL